MYTITEYLLILTVELLINGIVIGMVIILDDPNDIRLLKLSLEKQ